MSLSLDETANQLQNVSHHSKESAHMMSLYDPPCVEMQITVSVQQKNQKRRFENRGLHISISYSTETYQEINNVRDYDLERLWSSIGGFIGIFVGYSLLQVADLFDDGWRPYWRVLTNISCSVTYACTVVGAYLFQKRRFTLVQCIKGLNSTK